MRATLQIIAALITLAVLAGIHQGSGWVFDNLGTQFTAGFIAGAVFLGFFMALAMWWDRSATNPAGRREQQRPRNSIDL